jgi:hypothetical protein
MCELIIGGIIGIVGSAVGASIPLIAHYHDKKIEANKSKQLHYEQLLELAHKCWNELIDLPSCIRASILDPSNVSSRLTVYRVIYTPELAKEIVAFNLALQECRGLILTVQGDTTDGEIYKHQTEVNEKLRLLEKRVGDLANK